MSLRRAARVLGLMAAVSACAGCRDGATLPGVPSLELRRYMGDWYVIAAIPTFPERNAYNAVESYSLRSDGKIQVRFRYRDGSFTAPVKTLYPLGTIRPATGQAVWGMQFVWPMKAEYVIAYLDAGYQTAVVGRSKRDYVWIMARAPTLPESCYERLVERVAALGYDPSKLRKVPQHWPEPRSHIRDIEDRSRQPR